MTSSDAIERFRLQVRIARDWDEIGRGDAPVSTFGLQVGHLSSIGEELIAEITRLRTLRAENEQLRRERDAIRNETIEEAASVARKLLSGYDEGDDGFGVEDAIRRLA